VINRVIRVTCPPMKAMPLSRPRFSYSRKLFKGYSKVSRVSRVIRVIRVITFSWLISPSCSVDNKFTKFCKLLFFANCISCSSIFSKDSAYNT